MKLSTVFGAFAASSWMTMSPIDVASLTFCASASGEANARPSATRAGPNRTAGCVMVVLLRCQGVERDAAGPAGLTRSRSSARLGGTAAVGGAGWSALVYDRRGSLAVTSPLL